jgi:hypothetical protein
VRYSPLLQTSGPSSLRPCRPTLAAGDRNMGPGVPCPTQNQRNCRRVGKHFRNAPSTFRLTRSRFAYLSQLPLWINYRHVPLAHFPFAIDCYHSCLLLYYQISRHVPLAHFPFAIDCYHSCLLLYYQISRHVPLAHFPFAINCYHSCLLLYYQISRTALLLSCLYTPTLY